MSRNNTTRSASEGCAATVSSTSIATLPDKLGTLDRERPSGSSPTSACRARPAIRRRDAANKRLRDFPLPRLRHASRRRRADCEPDAIATSRRFRPILAPGESGSASDPCQPVIPRGDVARPPRPGPPAVLPVRHRHDPSPRWSGRAPGRNRNTARPAGWPCRRATATARSPGRCP
jgi:hypothetical protein